MRADILTKHPRSGDRFRYTLARFTLLQLVLGFLAGVVALAGLLGFFYWLTDAGGSHSFLFWWREAGLILVGFPTQTTEASEHGPRAVVQALAAVLGLIVPALALGTVVFKSLVSERVYATRRKLSVVPRENVWLNPPDKATTHWLAFRLYSLTRLQLVGVEFEAYARVRGTSAAGSPTVTNVQLPLGKANWPVSLTHVPYTVYAPLRAGDIEWRSPGGPRLLRVRDLTGYVHKVDDGCDLLLLVRGHVPQLGTDFVESHWFDSNTALTSKPFAEVRVDYPPHRKTWKGSSKWPGWDKFDAA